MKILYKILKKDMIKKLESKHFGEQFIDTVMDAFDIPSNLMKDHYKNLSALSSKQVDTDRISCELQQISDDYFDIQKTETNLDLLRNKDI